MFAVFQKIKADILGRPVLSVLITIALATSATLLTLALATLLNAGAPYDRAFAELNAAHVWLYFDRELVRTRDIARIESLPGVVDTTGLRHSMPNRVELGGERVWVSIQAIPAQPPRVNRLMIQRGHYPRRDELLASRDLAYLYPLSVGDVITVERAGGRKVALPVVGLAYDPMWDIYRGNQPPYVYLTEETFRKLFPDRQAWGWSLGLRLADPQAVDEVVAQVERMLRKDALKSYTDWRDVKQSAMFEVQLNFVFLGAFGGFALLAAALVIATSVSSTVLSQFRQIGILKAIGFTRGQVLGLYLGQYLVLGLVGGLVGILVGILLSPLPLQSAAVSLSTTLRPRIAPSLIAPVLLCVSGVVVWATWRSARKGANTNTIQAITTGAEPPRHRLPPLTRFAYWLGLPIPVLLGINDLFVRPMRSLLTGVNLTLGVMGIVFGLTLNDTLKAYVRDPSLVGIVYDAVVTREQTSHGKTRSLLNRAPGVIAFYSEHIVEVKTGDGRSFQVRAVQGALDAFPFRVEEGRFLSTAGGPMNEAIAGKGLLDWLGLRVGDLITVTLEDKEHRPLTWRIVGQYAERSNAGQMLIAPLASLERHLGHVEPKVYYLKLAPHADPEQVRRYLKRGSNDDLSFSLVGKNVPESILYLQLAILALASILIAVALINVFNTSLLAVREKTRVIGVLKAVGMTPWQVIGMVNTTAGFLGLVATLVGSPLGVAFTHMLLGMLSRMYGFGRVHTAFNPFHMLFLVPAIVTISMIGSIIPGWWAGRLPIVEVIRGE
ncbi:MAG: FtsX-like permease family protein [Anaerolineae bacterium]|nr:FtsX-like permease family protein [Anaerolineae bacterium]